MAATTAALTDTGAKAKVCRDPGEWSFGGGSGGAAPWVDVAWASTFPSLLRCFCSDAASCWAFFTAGEVISDDAPLYSDVSENVDAGLGAGGGRYMLPPAAATFAVLLLRNIDMAPVAAPAGAGAEAPLAPLLEPRGVKVVLVAMVCGQATK